MGINKIQFFVLLVLVLFPLVSANINVAIYTQNNFSFGEEIFFNYQILSETEQDVVFTPYIFCSDNPNALAVKKTIHLAPNVPFSEKYSVGILNEDFETGSCKSGIIIFSPEHKELYNDFQIITKLVLDFSLDFSKKVFIKNENINLNYTSSVQDLNIQATLIYPDKTSERVNLPISIKAEQIGTYELEIMANKEGYKPVTIKEQFAVIEKQAEIISASVCNTNSQCDGAENVQNCPQDCVESSAGILNNRFFLVIVSLLILGLVVIIIFLIVIKFKRKNTFS